MSVAPWGTKPSVDETLVGGMGPTGVQRRQTNGSNAGSRRQRRRKRRDALAASQFFKDLLGL